MKKSPSTLASIPCGRTLAKPLTASLVALLFAAQPVFAATYTWNTAATTGTWDDVNAWASGTVPTSADDAYFGNTATTSGTLAIDSVLGLNLANTGALTLSSGTLTIGSDGITRSGTGATTINSAVLLSSSQIWNNSTATGTLTLNGSLGASTGTVVLTSTGVGTTAITGLIGNGSGTLAIAANGGTLLLSGSNTYSGGTTLTGGTAVISGSGKSTYGALGTGTVTLGNGGMVSSTGATAAAIYNTILLTGSSNLRASATADLQIYGNLTGTGNVYLSSNATSAKTIAFNGDNSAYSGTMTVGSDNYLRAGFNSLNSGFANGVLVTYETNTAGIALGVSSGTISFGNLLGSGKIRANMAGTLTLEIGALGQSGTYSGVLQQANSNAILAIRKVGAGTWTLTGANLNTGTTTIVGGTLQIGTGGSITSSTAIVNNSALAFNLTTSATYSAPISGTGTLYQQGSGLLLLTGTNTYSGGTVLSGGTLQIGYASALGTGTVTGSGGTLDLNGYTLSNAVLTSTSVTLLNSVATTGTISSAISGAGLVKYTNGTLLVTGANTYSGGTLLTGGTLVLGSSSALGSGTVTVGSTIDLNGQNLANALANSGYTATFVNNAATTATVSGGFNASGTSGVVISDFYVSGTGNILWTGGISRSSSTGSFYKNGTGTLTLGGASAMGGMALVLNSGTVILSRTTVNSLSQGVTINGGVLKMDPTTQVTSGWAWGGAIVGNVTMNGGIWDLNDSGTAGYNNRVIGLTGTAGTVTNTGTAASLLVLAARNSNKLGFGGNIVDGANGGTVAISIINSGYQGSGDLFQFSGTNTYSGDTSISDNTLQAGSTTAFSKNSAYTLSSSLAKLDLNGYDNSIGSLAGTSGTVYLGSGNVTYTSGTNSLVDGGNGGNLTVGYNNQSTSFAGTIAGGGSLIKTGTGTLALGGSNTYTGATTINNGELDVNGSLATSSTVGVNAGTILGGSGTINGDVNVTSATINGQSLNIKGATTFTGASTMKGNTTLSGGGTVSSDTLTVSGTTTGNIGVSVGATLAGSGYVNGAATVSSGAIAGSGLRVGSGTFNGQSTLSGTTTFDNGAAVTSGSLTVLNGASISGALTVNNGATLVNAGSTTVNGALTINGGGTLSLVNGSSATTMTTTDSVTLDDNSTFEVRLAVGSVTASDLLSLTSGASLSIGSNVTLSLLVDDTLLGTSFTSGTWEIVSNDGQGYRTGAFANSTGTLSGYTYSVSYDGGNVYVELSAVPEPSTWAMIVGGVGMLAVGRRFRRWVD